jgi:hypothetical protein
MGRRRLLEPCLQVQIALKISIKVQKSLILIVGKYRAYIYRVFALLQALMQLAGLGIASKKKFGWQFRYFERCRWQLSHFKRCGWQLSHFKRFRWQFRPLPYPNSHIHICHNSYAIQLPAIETCGTTRSSKLS